MISNVIGSMLAGHRLQRPVAHWFAALGLLVMGGKAAMAAVDIQKENDYYSHSRARAVAVVEQYHLGPCQKWLVQGVYKKALGECAFILRIFPNHPEALLHSVRVCERWSSTQCTLDDTFSRAIAINPSASATYVLFGMYLHNRKDYTAALRSYQRALELDRQSVNGHYNIGLTYIAIKDYSAANAHAQAAYALGSQLPGLRSLLEKSGHWNPSAEPAAHSDAAPALDQSVASDRPAALK